MKLIASLAPARAEVDAGVVAKADQLDKVPDGIVDYSNLSAFREKTM